MPRTAFFDATFGGGFLATGRGEAVSTREQEFADSDKFETLRALPFFERFSDAEIWEVARISTWRTAKAGELIMKEGEPGDHFCILADGQVKVTKKGKLLNVLRNDPSVREVSTLAAKDDGVLLKVTATLPLDALAANLAAGGRLLRAAHAHDGATASMSWLH